jgi:hypothetical protein
MVREGGLTIFVGQRDLSADEVFAAYEELLERGATPLVLWDLTHATLNRVDAEAFRELAKRVAEAGSERRGRGKTAVVCGQLVDVGLVHMMGTYLGLLHYPVMLKVFSDRESAMAWLKGGIGKP